MPKIRVLVVEDSLTIRERLVETLSGDREIVGKTQDGKAAIELCQKLRPDVMTLDMGPARLERAGRDRVRDGLLPNPHPHRLVLY